MRPFGLFQTARAGIKARFVLPAAVCEVPCIQAQRALNVQQASLEGTQPKEEQIRGHGDGRGPTEAIVLRLQKSRKAQQPVKAVVGPVIGPLSGSSQHEKPEVPKQSKRSNTKSTGAVF